MHLFVGFGDLPREHFKAAAALATRLQTACAALKGKLGDPEHEKMLGMLEISWAQYGMLYRRLQAT
ncbi:hypothetical protein [Hydrogenophaga sp.]|uniref:hypothetical protein n=1 Tax=Hydrogenophaga sp. TaxID=1904254 RepID=UPI00271902EB|nr:hypothetical protein [Hydrogenophaga sp.]MDO9434262.1 hypothetical protein [Hydrogenophaga sp.]